MRLLVTLFSILNLEIWNEDVTKAYILVHNLSRAVYIKPTPQFQLPPDHNLKILKLLYVLSESDDAWFKM